ncbi:hypothetical protein [Rhodomicrobium vannielii]|uniref:hypothetical protein n=1 Tax=Rhodomicrobium vannielii TaxID=1069 RepID=UPI0012DF95BC|nr:hypothetical protein [Rhodomicrobium vannielii]
MAFTHEQQELFSGLPQVLGPTKKRRSPKRPLVVKQESTDNKPSAELKPSRRSWLRHWKKIIGIVLAFVIAGIAAAIQEEIGKGILTWTRELFERPRIEIDAPKPAGWVTETKKDASTDPSDGTSVKAPR